MRFEDQPAARPAHPPRRRASKPRLAAHLRAADSWEIAGPRAACRLDRRSSRCVSPSRRGRGRTTASNRSRVYPLVTVDRSRCPAHALRDGTRVDCQIAPPSSIRRGARRPTGSIRHVAMLRARAVDARDLSRNTLAAPDDAAPVLRRSRLPWIPPRSATAPTSCPAMTSPTFITADLTGACHCIPTWSDGRAVGFIEMAQSSADSLFASSLSPITPRRRRTRAASTASAARASKEISALDAPVRIVTGTEAAIRGRTLDVPADVIPELGVVNDRSVHQRSSSTDRMTQPSRDQLFASRSSGLGATRSGRLVRCAASRSAPSTPCSTPPPVSVA